MTPLAYPSPNHDERPEGVPIDVLVLHYTGMESGAAALDRLCDPTAKVSAHYLIEEDGSVFALVDESRRAWHAGVACWRGHIDINARSIGIELVNPGHEWGYRAFSDEQMQALLALMRDISTRHDFPSRNIVGHSDVAPQRKQDPGELFDWKGLHDAGFGIWPTPGASHDGTHDIAAALSEIGYETEDLTVTIRAFQRHFRPHRVTGEADEETRSLINGVLTACRG